MSLVVPVPACCPCLLSLLGASTYSLSRVQVLLDVPTCCPYLLSLLVVPTCCPYLLSVLPMRGTSSNQKTTRTTFTSRSCGCSSNGRTHAPATPLFEPPHTQKNKSNSQWGVHHREGTGSNRQKEGHGFTSQVGTGTRDNKNKQGQQAGTR